MRFKPGEMAYIKRPWNIDEDIGRPVTIVRLGVWREKFTMRNGETSNCCEPNGAEGLAWLVDSHGAGFPCFIADVCLGKLGGDEHSDEMLTIAGKPEGVTA